MAVCSFFLFFKYNNFSCMTTYSFATNFEYPPDDLMLEPATPTAF